MIIDTVKVDKMLRDYDAETIANITGISIRTIEGYQQGRNWLGKNAMQLAETGEELTDYFDGVQSFLNDLDKYRPVFDIETVCLEALRELARNEYNDPQEGDGTSYTIAGRRRGIKYVEFHFTIVEVGGEDEDFIHRYRYDYCDEHK